ncbi:MAG: hypothetical protein WBD09_00095 [Halobacteriota archaeon]
MRIHIISELKGGWLYVNRDGDVGVCITGSGYAGLPLAKSFAIENKSV